MESTPYVQPTRQRRRCQWRRSSENSLSHVDLHATQDVLWDSQASLGMQARLDGFTMQLFFAFYAAVLSQRAAYGRAAHIHAGGFCERLTEAQGCLGNSRPSEMHTQSGMELGSPNHMEDDPLISPPSPCARHPRMVGLALMHSMYIVWERPSMHCSAHWCHHCSSEANEGSRHAHP